MAVTVEELAVGLRLSIDGADLPAPQVAVLSRLLGVGEAHVDLLIPDAPDAIRDECVVRLASYLYNQPEGRRDSHSNSWVNSGAGSLAVRWRVQATPGTVVLPAENGAGGGNGNGLTGLDAQAVADMIAEHQAIANAHFEHGDTAGIATHNEAGDSHTDLRNAIDNRITQNQVEETAQRLIDSAGHATNIDLGRAGDEIEQNREDLAGHIAQHPGGNGGTPASQTPPVVLVDAELYTAYGDLTIPAWRTYDFFQLFFTNGADTFQSEPVNSAQLIALSPVVVSMSRNVGWRLTIDASDDDVITIATTGGNTIAAPTATSTITAIGWFAGTVVDGGGGGDGTDETARTAAAAAQTTADANTVAATAHAANANVHHTPPTGEGGGDGDDAYDWATVGNDALLVPTDKINFSGVQNQIDEIVDQIAHSEGTITAVVGQLGGGNAALRYTLPVDLDGLYDLSVRVKARVQINEFQNISGNLHIIEDGGLGLNAVVPEATHNYKHAHDGVLNFIRKGLAISPGIAHLDFTTLVTGATPPDVHFVEVENLTITDTSLVNAENVGEFVQDWAEAGNVEQIPGAKLSLGAQALGAFDQTDIDDIPLGGAQAFEYVATVQKDLDGTLAYVGGGWAKATAGGGGGLTPVKVFTSSGTLAEEEEFFVTPLDAEAWYQILLKNDRGLTTMISGKFLETLNNVDPVYVRGWLRGSATSYLEFQVQKNGTNVEFIFYGPSTVNFQTNLEVWKFS